MTILFWDIDGTLLTTAKGGVFAWDDAVKEITGRDFQLASMRIPGMTDYQIAVSTLESLGLTGDAAIVERLVRRYEELLPSSLPRKAGYVLPNVKAILDGLQGRRDVRSYLLTGNTRGGAHAKLTHYELWSVLSRRRVCRRPRRPGDDCRACTGAGATRRAGDAGRCVRDRRHAARHPLRQRDRRAHDRRGHGRV